MPSFVITWSHLAILMYTNFFQDWLVGRVTVLHVLLHDARWGSLRRNLLFGGMSADYVKLQGKTRGTRVVCVVKYSLWERLGRCNFRARWSVSTEVRLATGLSGEMNKHLWRYTSLTVNLLSIKLHVTWVRSGTKNCTNVLADSKCLNSPVVGEKTTTRRRLRDRRRV